MKGEVSRSMKRETVFLSFRKSSSISDTDAFISLIVEELTPTISLRLAIITNISINADGVSLKTDSLATSM